MTTAIAISGSPSRQSKSRRLLVHAVERLARDGISARTLDLADLPSDDLLGRTRTAAIEDALASALRSRPAPGPRTPSSSITRFARSSPASARSWSPQAFTAPMRSSAQTVRPTR